MDDRITDYFYCFLYDFLYFPNFYRKNFLLSYQEKIKRIERVEIEEERIKI